MFEVPNTEMPLAELIALCLDKDPVRSTRGFDLLYARYNKMVYSNLWSRCKKFREKDINDLINDLSSDVWSSVKQGLPNFKNAETKENERSFQGWLKTITNNAVNKYIRNKKDTSTISIDETEFIYNSDQGYVFQELYEEMVFRIRSTAQTDRTGNLERDIHIYFLDKVRGVEPDTIYDHPCIGQYVQHRGKTPGEIDDEFKRGYIHRISGRVREKLRKLSKQ